MKTPLLIACLCLCFASQAEAQANIQGLPAGATVIETRKLVSASHPNRKLVLWMVHPKKNPSGYSANDVYPCPDQTRGSYYSGPTRVSLIDSTNRRVINTINIAKDWESLEDSFDLPYAIRKGYYYHVAALTKQGVEAKPTIMWLRDYNGDGKAFEFALFDALACMGLETTLIGYSEKPDRVIQYPIKLEVVEGSKHMSRVTSWADYLFSKKPLRLGYWKYDIDYRGRGGTLDKWDVRYDAVKEQFIAKVISVAGQ